MNNIKYSIMTSILNIFENLFYGFEVDENILKEYNQEIINYALLKGSLFNYRLSEKLRIKSIEYGDGYQSLYYMLMCEGRKFNISREFICFLPPSKNIDNFIKLIKHDEMHNILSFYFTFFKRKDLFDKLKLKYIFKPTYSLINDYKFPNYYNVNIKEYCDVENIKSEDQEYVQKYKFISPYIHAYDVEEDFYGQFVPRMLFDKEYADNYCDIDSEDEKLHHYNGDWHALRISSFDKYIVDKYLLENKFSHKKYSKYNKLIITKNSLMAINLVENEEYRDYCISRFIEVSPINSINIFNRYKPFLRFFYFNLPLEFFSYYKYIYEPSFYLLCFYYILYDDVLYKFKYLLNNNFVEINLLSISYAKKHKYLIKYFEDIIKENNVYKYFDFDKKQYYENPIKVSYEEIEKARNCKIEIKYFYDI